MLVTIAGGWQEHYSPCGVNRPVGDLLFPINHGILYYPGFDVLPPFVVYRADCTDVETFEQLSDALRERMRNMETDEPIAYRMQNSGDYLIPSMELRPGLAGGKSGFDIHIKGPESGPDNTTGST